jgi:hypothetical protein
LELTDLIAYVLEGGENEEGASAEEQPSEQRPRRSKRSARPCKSKRDRYHKMVHKATEEIMRDPAGFTLEAMTGKLPPSVSNNVWLKDKFTRRMLTIHQHALEELAEDQRPNKPPAPAPESMPDTRLAFSATV